MCRGETNIYESNIEVFICGGLKEQNGWIDDDNLEESQLNSCETLVDDCSSTFEHRILCVCLLPRLMNSLVEAFLNRDAEHSGVNKSSFCWEFYRLSCRCRRISGEEDDRKWLRVMGNLFYDRVSRHFGWKSIRLCPPFFLLALLRLFRLFLFGCVYRVGTTPTTSNFVVNI